MVGLTRARPAVLGVHPGWLGSLECALGVVGWLGSLACALEFVWFNLGGSVHSSAPCGSLGSSEVTRARPVGRWVHPGSLGSLVRPGGCCVHPGSLGPLA